MGRLLAALMRGIMGAFNGVIGFVFWTIELPFKVLREAVAPGFAAAMAEARAMPTSPDRSTERSLLKSLESLKEAQKPALAPKTTPGTFRTPAIDVIDFCKTRDPMKECDYSKIEPRVLKALMKLSPEQRTALSKAAYTDVVAWMNGAEPKYPIGGVPSIAEILASKREAPSKPARRIPEPARRAANDDVETGNIPAVTFG